MNGCGNFYFKDGTRLQPDTDLTLSYLDKYLHKLEIEYRREPNASFTMQRSEMRSYWCDNLVLDLVRYEATP